MATPAPLRRSAPQSGLHPGLQRRARGHRGTGSPRRPHSGGGRLARFADPVDRLGCLRGISALTGLALTVEIGDWSRFTGSSIGAYVGLVPSEYSSGNSRVQGSITKAGNTHVRRLLIESAWHHRKSYSTSGPTLRARWAKVDPALRARGHAGNRSLNKRWRSFTERGKNPLVANVAIARELAGWCWSLATMQ